MDREAVIARVHALQGALARRTIGEQAGFLVDAHLTVAQLHALIALDGAPGCATAELASRVGLKPNVATGVVQRLVERGWVDRAPDPDDGRVRRLALSDAGREVVTRLSRAAEQAHEPLLATLSDVQLRQLTGILETLVAGADRAGKTPE